MQLVSKSKAAPLLDRHIRIDREVYAELLRRVNEIQARSGTRRIPINAVLRALLFDERDRMTG